MVDPSAHQPRLTLNTAVNRKAQRERVCLFKCNSTPFLSKPTFSITTIYIHPRNTPAIRLYQHVMWITFANIYPSFYSWSLSSFSVPQPLYFCRAWEPSINPYQKQFKHHLRLSRVIYFHSCVPGIACKVLRAGYCVPGVLCWAGLHRCKIRHRESIAMIIHMELGIDQEWYQRLEKFCNGHKSKA